MIWVSAITGRPGSASHVLFNAFLRGDITVVTSGPLVDELAETLVEDLGRPFEVVESFVTLLCARADVVAIQHQVMGCHDPNDDPVLETAIAGQAEVIVTRDRRLLRLPRHVADYMECQGIRTVLPEGLLDILRKAPTP